LPLTAHRNRQSRSRGQSLAEFALVFPFFMIILFFVIEFAFALNAYLAIDFASREAALAGAEAGNDTNADCAILRAVERSIQPPAADTNIQQVRIFKANATGDEIGPVTIYTRTNSIPCPLLDGTPSTLPYTRGTNTYPPSARCNVLAGCTVGTPGSVDTIGVEISYGYDVKTPVYSLINSSGSGWIMTKSNAMRMEPIL
jgi:TadE-like protein